VLDEDTDIVRLALRTIKFYQHESCGWCIPCREGTTWLKKILTRFHEGGGREEDIGLIADVAKSMFGRTFCALGDAAAMPTMAFIDKYRDEFADYLKKSEATKIPELVLL
jgi:NADH-quinone oxidoreductase subunit F